MTSLLFRMPSSASPSTSVTAAMVTPFASVPVSSLVNHSFAQLLRKTGGGGGIQ